MWRILVSGVSLAAWALVLDRRKLGARAAQTNYTMDDMNMTIVYSSSGWIASNNASGCNYCLAPQDHDVAFDGTWHHGLHVLPITDDDDNHTTTSLSVSTSTSVRSSPSRTPTSGNEDEGQSDGKGSDKDGSHKGRSRRSAPRAFIASMSGVAAALQTASPPLMSQNFDSDDPQFVEEPVFAQFNFSGSALFVNCLLPLGVPENANMTPTFTNLTFTLDGQPAGNFLHDGSPQGEGFQPNATIFSQTALSQGQHTFRIDLGPNSVILLDSIVLTQDDASVSANSTTSDPAGASSSDSKSLPSENNAATFAAAIGGSVGTIAAMALCVAGSLIRRRQRAAKRDRRERERAYWNSDSVSFHTFDDVASVARSTRPSMRAVAPPGPLTFVPRYFPGVVPPPTYRLASGVDTSYAEVLPDDEAEEDDDVPATVPEPIDEVDEVPPSFAVAIASPEPPLLATAMRRDHSFISPNPEMSEAGFTVPLLSHTGLVSPRPPLSRPPSFHSEISSSAVPSVSVSPQSSEPASVTDATSVRSSGEGDSRSVRSLRPADVVSDEGGVRSGEEAGEGAGGDDGPTKASDPNGDAQGAPERMWEGEVGEATVGTTPGT